MDNRTKTKNVFAEIGCPTPEALLLKAKLMVADMTKDIAFGRTVQILYFL